MIATSHVLSSPPCGVAAGRVAIDAAADVPAPLPPPLRDAAVALVHGLHDQPRDTPHTSSKVTAGAAGDDDFVMYHAMSPA